MLRPIQIGIAEPFLVGTHFTNQDDSHFRFVRKSCYFIENLGAFRLSQMRMMKLVAATVSEDHERSLCRLTWPDVALDGIIIFPFPHAAGYRTEYETMNVQSIWSNHLGELPVCVLPHPDDITSGAMSKVTISVRSSYYSLCPGHATLSHWFQVIERIESLIGLSLTF